MKEPGARAARIDVTFKLFFPASVRAYMASKIITAVVYLRLPLVSDIVEPNTDAEQPYVRSSFSLHPLSHRFLPTVVAPIVPAELCRHGCASQAHVSVCCYCRLLRLHYSSIQHTHTPAYTQLLPSTHALSNPLGTSSARSNSSPSRSGSEV